MTKKITLTAILLALYIMLKISLPTLIIIPGIIQFNLIYLTLPLIGMLIGPKRGFFFGIVADLILYFYMSTAIFNPIFMLSEGIFCFLGGYFYYKKDLSLKRILLSNIVIVYFGIVVMNTIALIFQFIVLAPNPDKLQSTITVAVIYRIITATFVYYPLMSALFFLPREQWARLQQRFEN
ncbi:hypothetical protein AwErysi_01510 [Erysipelotrichaceae bacterium]|nr:hypothetical protein AwErysi_01510 [Erysipelotrichaceae bacterium]